ncbi:MAG: hypothetical protein HY739_00660 [Desulfobacterales bacterium]|nr:hypothetical protein [Desulfobacterales bacterium]
MCMVVDINTFAPVFNETCNCHPEFAPVKKWIETGHGFLVFGGTRYKEELGKAYRYLRLVRQMKISGQAIAIQDNVVDAAETEIRGRTAGSNCDDQHIIALLGVSRCPLFCSKDARSYRYITDRTLYPNGMQRVRIYSSSRNQSLLRPMQRNSLRYQA